MAVDVIARGMAGGGGSGTLIEKIKINGTPLVVDETDKSVNIPVASKNVLGVVKSTGDENIPNGVLINLDGTMQVNSVEFSSLVQTREDPEMVLCGGDSDS